jgi:succinate-acetate transporter protein
LKKIKILIFSGISKFLKLIVFGQILTKFGSFGQFWADSVAMVVADSMPSFERKEKKNVITFAKSVRILLVMACWKAL